MTQTRYRLSLGQQALYFLHRLAPMSSAYNVAAGVRVHEPVDLAALGRSVRLVADRHDVLQSYYDDDGTATSRVSSTEPVELEVRQALDEGGDLPKLVEQLVAEPFQLQRRPPFRVVLLRADDGDVLLTSIHHIATDLSSQLTVVRELLHCYAESLGRRTPRPSTVGPAFSEHVDAEEEYLQSPARAVAEEYWQRVCRDAGQVGFAATAMNDAAVGRYLSLDLDARVTRTVEESARRHGVTVFQWLLAAFQVAVVRTGGGSDFLLGYPATLRRQARQRQAVGYYINVLPLRVRLTPSATLPEVAVWTAGQIGQARAHQRYPLALMPCRLGMSTRADGRPPVQVAFNMMMAYPPNALLESLATGRRVEFAGLPVSGIDIQQQAGQTPLAMDACHLPGRIMARLKFQTEWVSSGTAEELLGHFRSVLERTG